MNLQVEDGKNYLVLVGATCEVIEYLKMERSVADAVAGVLMSMDGEATKDRAVMNLNQEAEKSEALIRVSITEDDITIERGPNVQYH